MEVILGDHEATIHHRSMVADEVWQLGFVGLVQGVVELTGFDGNVSRRVADDSHPVFRRRWPASKHIA